MDNHLGMQYIMDGNGNYYRLNGNDQLVVAGSKDEASVFTSVEADERIGRGKKARFYHTIPVDDIDELEEKIIAGSGRKREAEFLYDMEEIDWLEYMNYFVFVSNSAKSYQEGLARKHSDVEKEICDLLHYVELYDLTDEESVRTVEMLKDARQRRRDIKDEISRAEFFQKSIGTSANVAKAKSCISELKKLENRSYYPRMVKDIFHGMDGRRTVRKAYCEKHKADEGGYADQEEDFCENTQEEKTMDYIRKETVFDGRHNDWIGLAKSQMEFFANIRQYMINLELELDAVDRAIEEMLVTIEDANYNATQGYKAFKELKNLRNKRREKGRELESLKVMTGCFDCEAMADAYRYSAETMESIVASAMPKPAEVSAIREEKGVAV